MSKYIKTIIITISILLFSFSFAYAENIEMIFTSGDYTLKLVTTNIKGGYNTFYEGQYLKDYDIMLMSNLINKSGEKCYGSLNWANPEYILTKGEQTVELIYTPIQKTPKPVQTTTFSLSITTTGTYQKPTRFTDNEIPNNDNDTTTTNASLTTSTLMLTSSKSSYDINIDNKPENASYSWSSSDTNIAKVDKNGVVTAVSDGQAEIICTVTEPNGNKKELKSKVIVGQDDNLPILNCDDLDMEASDTYKLKVDNKISGSIVSFKSTNKSIAKVSTGGKVSAIKTGSCSIIVTITAPNKEVTVLKCNITIE